MGFLFLLRLVTASLLWALLDAFLLLWLAAPLWWGKLFILLAAVSFVPSGWFGTLLFYSLLA